MKSHHLNSLLLPAPQSVQFPSLFLFITNHNVQEVYLTVSTRIMSNSSTNTCTAVSPVLFEALRSPGQYPLDALSNR